MRGEEGAVTVERTDRSEEKGIRKKKKTREGDKGKKGISCCILSFG